MVAFLVLSSVTAMRILSELRISGRTLANDYRCNYNEHNLYKVGEGVLPGGKRAGRCFRATMRRHGAERSWSVIVHAELSCLTCGYDVGDVEGERGGPVDDLVFLPVHQGDRLLVDGQGRFRCPRCGSRVLPQGVSPVKRPIDRATVLEADLAETIAAGSLS
jgi:hypothetical protein